MQYIIIQTNLTENEERVMFKTSDFELAEMLYNDYVRQSNEDYAYELREKIEN